MTVFSQVFPYRMLCLRSTFDSHRAMNEKYRKSTITTIARKEEQLTQALFRLVRAFIIFKIKKTDKLLLYSCMEEVNWNLYYD